MKGQLTSISLLSLLALTSGWVTGQTIVPLPAHAYTGQVNVAIDISPKETYDALLRRAEAIARAAAQRSFDRDILVTEVSVVVMAQNEVTVVPVLSLAATRAQWRSRPDPQRWATYYGSAKGLLGLNTPATTRTTATPTASTPRSTTTQTAPASTSVPGRPTSTAPTSTTPASTSSPQEPFPPSTALPGQILPNRIPTPGGIGKQ